MSAMPLLALPASAEGMKFMNSWWPIIDHTTRCRDAHLPLLLEVVLQIMVSMKRVCEHLCCSGSSSISPSGADYKLLSINSLLLAINRFSQRVLFRRLVRWMMVSNTYDYQGMLLALHVLLTQTVLLICLLVGKIKRPLIDGGC